MSLTLFDWIKQITYEKKSWDSFSDEDKKQFSIYMIHRFLSQKEDYIELVNYIQGLSIQDPERVYRIYCNLIPKKQVYLKYTKSTTKSANKDLLKEITKYYQCSTREAEDYVSLLGKDGCKEILEALGIEQKEITKLIK
jgi:hypothetical protein